MESPWILALCHEFPPLGGGAGKNLSLLCRELTSRGVQVRVWTADPGRRNRGEHPFPVEYIATSRTERFETNLAGMAAFVRGTCALGWRRRRDRPALVFANLGIPAGVAGWFLSLLFRAPLAVWHHGSDVHAGRPEGPGLLQRMLLRLVWGRARLNFFVAAGLKDRAADLGNPRGARILPACPSPEILQSGLLPAVDFDAYFLFLGRFDPVKNPLLAVKAMALLKARGEAGRHLRLVGSGALGKALLETLSAAGLTRFVTLEAAAPFAAVPELLKSAYALVVPSRIEGFNTTLLEAAHFGVPAVASDTAGIRDFVRDGVTGLLFPENDAAGLADALARLSADPALRDALGARARAAAQPFRPERVADAFLAGAESVLPGMGALAREASAWN